MTDVSLAGAFLAGLVSFLSPCVLPLVPGYISMLSGIGMEQLRQGEVPRGGLFSSALAFVTGFSVVFISFGATASAVGSFLKENRHLLIPIAGALILLFGLHLLGLLIKLSLRAGIVLGALLVVLGIVSLIRHAPLVGEFGALHFFSLSLIGFFGPALARWLNRDVHLRSSVAQPGAWSGFLLGFAFAFGWTPCIGPILSTVLAIAAASDKIARGVLLLAVYSAGLAIPFLLTALGISRFMVFYKNFRKYLHAVELFSGALLLFIGGLVFVNKLTWLASKLDFLNTAARYLEHALTIGTGARIVWLCLAAIVVSIVVWVLARNWAAVSAMPGKRTILMVAVVLALIVTTVLADRATRIKTGVPAVRADTANATPAPEVTFKDLDGKDVPLDEYKGKVVLVNFWATWCEPCQVEIPWLIEMQQKYSSKGFTILGVDVDDEDNKVVSGYLSKERFMVNGQKIPMNYPVMRGNDAVADKFGGLLGYPTSFLISRDGKIVKKVQGLISYEEIANAIEEQLNSVPATQNKPQIPSADAASPDRAPEVTFKNLDGKDVPLSEYKGKVALVSFWATWCEACQIEIPWLIEMQQKYSAQGFTVLGLDVDDEDNQAVSGYLAKERFDVNGRKVSINYPILRGNDVVADKFGGLIGYPTSFLISRDGKIVKKVQGLISYEEIANAIEGQL